MEDRYNRQKIINQWDQQSLTNARVMVVGAGALGNEILKNLALLGFGKLLIVDFDNIEISNLSRTVLFRDADIGLSKAETAATAIKDLNPESKAIALHGDVFYDIGLGVFRHADLIISGLDNLAARSKVAHSAMLSQVPFLDGGVWSNGGEVRCFLPGQSFCFDCTLSETDWLNAHIRKSCSGFKEPVALNEMPAPSNIVAVSIIAGMVTQEAVLLLQQKSTLESGDALVYNGLRRSLDISRLPGEDDCKCRLGEALGEVISLQKSVYQTTAKELLDFAAAKLGAPARLELGRNLLIGYRNECATSSLCPHSGTVFQPKLLAHTSSEDAWCGHCNQLRLPSITTHINDQNPLSFLTIKELGVPPGDILTLTNPNGMLHVEMTQDVESIWENGLQKFKA